MSSPRRRRGGVEAILGGAEKRIEERKEETAAAPVPAQKSKQKVSYYLDQNAIVALEEIKITLRKAGLSPRSVSYSHIIEAAIKAFQQELDASPTEVLSRFGKESS